MGAKAKGVVVDGVMTPRRLAALAVLSVTAIWGVTFPLNKLALASVDPVALTLWRFALAAVALGVVAVLGRRRLTRTSLWAGTLSGLALAGGYVTQVEGQRFVAPALAGFLTGLSVVLVPLGVLVVGRRPTRRQLVGIAIAVLALVVLTHPQGNGSLLGVGLELACATFFAAQIVILEALDAGGDPLVVAAVQMGTIALVAAGLGPVLGVGLIPHRAGIVGWVAILYDGLGASALAFLVQAWALAHASSVEISVLYGAEPLFAALSSVLFGYGGLGAATLAGGMLVVVAVVVTSTPPGTLRPLLARRARRAGT